MLKKRKKNSFVTCVALLTTMLPFSGSMTVIAASPSAPSGLLVEYVSNPLGIDTLTPGFSWVVNDSDRGEYQTAYQIIVASSLANISSNIGDKWDSGKITSSDSTNVKYEGSVLSPKTRYWWKVRTWDKDNNQSEYSSYGFFDVALRNSDWTASYIWDGTTNANNWAYFRKEFTISKTVNIGKLYVTAHDNYKVYLNGTLLGRGPAQSDPVEMMQYNSYDISSNLVQGTNVIAVVAYWKGQSGMAGVKGSPSFILESDIKFTDGTSTTVKTDKTWKALATTPWNESSAIRGPSYSMCTAVEDYDARKEVNGWINSGFNDSSWASAQIVSRNYTKRAQMVPMQKVEVQISPMSVNQTVSGVWLVDFGQNLTGWPSLIINNAKAGTVITIWNSEVLNNGRIVRNRIEMSNNFDKYTCKAGTQTFEPDTGYGGFRYLEIEGYPGTLTSDNIKMNYSHQDLNKTGDFICSNTLFNDIYNICVRTQKNNAQQVLVDCPTREQTGYITDSYIMSNNIMYNFSNYTIMKKVVDDWWASRLSNGNLLSSSPAEHVQEIPEWTLHWIMALWDQYFYYNDKNSLESMYPTLQGVLNYFNKYRNNSTNLLTNTPGWEISDYPNGGMDMNGSSLTPQNCLYYGALVCASKIATVLGKTTYATNYHNIANNVRNGINTTLFNGTNKYRDCNGSSSYHATASVFALYFDVVEENKKTAVINYVKALGFQPSVYGGWYLSEAMYRNGEAQHMYNLINQTRSQWGRMVNQGETTTWEDWNGGLSRSHAWSAYPMKFFLSYVSGIESTDVAYSKFQIKPQIEGGLTYAQGTVPTIKGNITTRWDKTTDGLTLSATIPVNTSAKVYIPCCGSSILQIKEGSTTIWNDGKYNGGVDGIAYNSTTTEYVIFDVGSGSYSFTINGSGEYAQYIQPVQPMGPAGPEGYTYICDEDQSYTFTQPVDVAYGANGSYKYKTKVKGTIIFNNTTFGDPISGTVKYGFYKRSGSPMTTTPLPTPNKYK